nr:LysR family transcriptional regulator [Raoultella sp. NCTC 9187]
MKAFGAAHNAIFVAPTLYAHDFYHDESIIEIGRMENVMEEYHAIFAERMIQHPAVQRICNATTRRSSPRRRADGRQISGIKKPAFAGFSTKR